MYRLLDSAGHIKVLTEGNLLQDALLVLRVDRLCHVRGDEARRNSITGDAAAGVLTSNRLREADHTSLLKHKQELDCTIR